MLMICEGRIEHISLFLALLVCVILFLHIGLVYRYHYCIYVLCYSHPLYIRTK